MAKEFTFIDEAGNEVTRELSSAFAISFPERDEEGKFYPAWTRNIDLTRQSKVAETTDQCGNTKVEAYGSEHNDVYEVECVIADGSFTFGPQNAERERRNLSLEEILNFMVEGEQVNIYTSYQNVLSPQTVVTDVNLVNNQEITDVTVHRPEAQQAQGPSTFGPYEGHIATFQFGEEENNA